jgi:hypothetical protein
MDNCGAVIEGFTGRQLETQLVYAWLRQGVRSVVITGERGIGKTQVRDSKVIHAVNASNSL